MFLIDTVATKKCGNHDQCCDGYIDQSLGTILHKAQEGQGKKYLRPVQPWQSKQLGAGMIWHGV